MKPQMQKYLSKLALIALLACSQTVSAEDLVTVYGLALKNDAELQIAESDYLAAIEAVPFARSAYRPQLSFDANAAASEIDDSETGDSSDTNTGYGVNLTQSLYDNVVIGNIDAAEAVADAALARVQAARQSLVLRVAPMPNARPSRVNSNRLKNALKSASSRSPMCTKRRHASILRTRRSSSRKIFLRTPIRHSWSSPEKTPSEAWRDWATNSSWRFPNQAVPNHGSSSPWNITAT
jgi:hypothetical protein